MRTRITINGQELNLAQIVVLQAAVNAFTKWLETVPDTERTPSLGLLRQIRNMLNREEEDCG